MERCLWEKITDSYQCTKTKRLDTKARLPDPVRGIIHDLQTCLQSHLISHDREVGYRGEKILGTLWAAHSILKYHLSPEASGQCEEKENDKWRIAVRNDKPDVPWWVFEVTNHGRRCVCTSVCVFYVSVSTCAKWLFGESWLEMFDEGADLKHFMFLSSH